jgi:predicted TIM-barrel fold metal-dependent hydrolase
MAADHLCSNTSRPHRVDTHHHFFPPAYLAAHRGEISGIAAEFAAQVLDWTPQKSLEVMDRDGVATAIASLSSPGLWFGDVKSTTCLARECNEFAARMSSDYAARFEFFATLPLPDVDASLREIAYAADVLGAVGFGLMTNYGEIWPGDARFAPVFDELNRRRAVVYFHPVSVNCCANVLSEVPAAILEYPFDTTRAITSLLYSGTMSRCPDIRFIFSHGGGALPMLASRIARYAKVRPELSDRLPNGASYELQRLYCDVVSVVNPISFQAIKSLIGVDRLLFGSDFPYWAPKLTSQGLSELGLSVRDLHNVECGNARALFEKPFG